MSDQRQPTCFQANEGVWLRWLGHPIRYLATEAETGGRYCMSIGTAGNGQGAPPHRHDFDEGFSVLRGEVEFTAGNQRVILGTGDFINISAGTAHYPRVVSEDDADLLTIAAPANASKGFDKFQLGAGERLETRDSKPTKSDREILSAIKNLAPQYGIELNPLQEAFSEAPRIEVTRTNRKRSLNRMLTGCLRFKILEHDNGGSSLGRSMAGLAEGV